MSFDTRAGTRGSRQPRAGGALGRWVTKRVINRIRRTGKAPGLGFNALVLTTIGRKSGVERQTPVGWFPDDGDGDGWVIVASAAGAARNPAWYHNLAAHPDQVWIETAGRKVAVTAEQLHGADRDAAWRRVIAAVPRFAQYERKTDRELPVIRLVPRSG
jgi:deazaflavin-dependent oxidoreductase (nitroreductase family)